MRKKREKTFKIMEKSNSGMMGHGMPANTHNTTKIHRIKVKKSQDATRYMQLDEPTFAGVKTDEGIIIVCGKYRVSTKTFKTFDEANDYVNSKPYDIIINTAVLITKLENDEKEIKTMEQENEPNK